MAHSASARKEWLMTETIIARLRLAADTLAAGAAGAAWGYLRAAHGTAGAEQRMLRARDLRELAQALYDLEWEGNDDA